MSSAVVDALGIAEGVFEVSAQLSARVHVLLSHDALHKTVGILVIKEQNHSHRAQTVEPDAERFVAEARKLDERRNLVNPLVQFHHHVKHRLHDLR